jgi:hypothetical protein
VGAISKSYMAWIFRLQYRNEYQGPSSLPQSIAVITQGICHVF